MIGKLESAQIEEVLNNNIVGRLGCHAKGVTYIVPISYVYDGKYIYGHTQEGMKMTILRHNPTICFEVDEMENMANWRSVIAWGDVEELTDPAARIQALEVLTHRILPMISSETTHLSPYWPFPPDNINSIPGIVFRAELTVKTGRFENNEGITGAGS